MATVEDGLWGMKKVFSTTPLPIRLIPPNDFLDVLFGWGHSWIWDAFVVTGGTGWIVQAIEDNSLVAATDRSYIKEHFPALCSAAFVMEFIKGRG